MLNHHSTLFEPFKTSFLFLRSFLEPTPFSYYLAKQREAKYQARMQGYYQQPPQMGMGGGGMGGMGGGMGMGMGMDPRMQMQQQQMMNGGMGGGGMGMQGGMNPMMGGMGGGLGQMWRNLVHRVGKEMTTRWGGD